MLRSILTATLAAFGLTISALAQHAQGSPSPISVTALPGKTGYPVGAVTTAITVTNLNIATVNTGASVPDPAHALPTVLQSTRRPSRLPSPPSLPLVFEPNRGQSGAKARFLARGTGFSLLLADREAVLTLRRSAPVTMRLAGGSAPSRIEALEPTGGVSNYYLGNDPATWRANVPHFRKIRYWDVYPGIDQVFYGDAGTLEFDLVVAPGADASRIELAYDGTREIRLGPQGDLLLATDAGDIRIRRPVVYQTGADGKRIPVEAAFRLAAYHRATLALARYDSKRELVIDPAVEYSTYLGGSGADEASGIALDSSGNAYITGTTSLADFPIVNSPFSGGATAATSASFVTKLNASGTALIYSTFLGNAVAYAVTVDPAGNAYVTGFTGSKNFPVQNPLQAALKGISNAFITKFGAAGALVYSTYLGGSNADAGNGIAADATGNAYVTGTTSSANFPTKNPLQQYKATSSNAFVSKIVPDGSGLIYSTFLGGSYIDTASGIAVDSAGNAYVTGSTTSPDFPVTKSISPPIVLGFTLYYDAFVTKLNSTGSAIVYSTVLGGQPSSLDTTPTSKSIGIAVDSSGDAYIAGNTAAPDFPTVKPLFSSGASFVSEVNATGSALVYSTFLSGCTLNAIAIDAAGDAYVTGESSEVGAFPLQNAIQPTGQALSPTLTAFSAGGSSLFYSTYLGREGSGTAIASDAAGDVYVTGSGLGLPVSSQAFQPTANSYPYAFIFAYSSAVSPAVTTVNAASFAGGQPVAPNSIASAFGTELATQTASSPATLGTMLGGTTVNITDSAQNTVEAGLFYASPGQVNLLVPSGVALGAAQVEITAGNGARSVGPLQIASIAPGIFTADGRLAVGTALTVNAQGAQTSQSLVQYNSSTATFTAVPINLGPSTNTTYLVLYGTGIRDATLSSITITIGDQTVAPLYAGLQGQYSGEDQINVQIPNSLAGTGDVAITLTAAGIASNTVHVTIQ
jgi:uncharacterized protein (TIGR03437 family)